MKVNLFKTHVTLQINLIKTKKKEKDPDLVQWIFQEQSKIKVLSLPCI
jgi:hypothetical protein